MRRVVRAVSGIDAPSTAEALIAMTKFQHLPGAIRATKVRRIFVHEALPADRAVLGLARSVPIRAAFARSPFAHVAGHVVETERASTSRKRADRRRVGEAVVTDKMASRGQ